MKIVDIHNILNSEFTNETDSTNTTILAADLSNIYDYGHSFVFGQSLAELESALRNVVTKISKVVTETSDYISNAPKILKDSAEYLGTIETIRMSLPDNMFDDNYDWDVVTARNTNNFDRMFGYKGVDVKANYTDKVRPFEIKISKTVEQFRDAFVSAEAMVSFFGNIETLVNNYMTWAIDKLNIYTFVNGVVGAYNDRGSSIVKSAGNTTADFINLIKKELRNFESFTDLYKSSGFVTATPKSKLKLFINGTYYDEMSTALADTRHPNFLNIPMDNVQDLNYFQSPAEPDKISAKTANGDDTVTIDNIVAIIADERAMATTVSNKRVAIVPVPNEEFSNYFYKFSGQSYNNLDYPILIITKNGTSDITTA